MLVTLNEVLKDAQKKKYAVGLFNTVNLEMAKGVIEAAEETNSPVIVGTAEVLLPYAGLEELTSFLLPMAKKAKVPVVLHFDHGLTQDKILEALKLGFSSIMYDCSGDSFEDNISNMLYIKKITNLYGASLEAELGHVGANMGKDDSIYTEPEEARKFVERTEIDALAIAIGTAHGAYKETPKLDINRLSQIAREVSVPLVLHGGSGLSDDDFKNCIQNGITKVNIFTDINCAAAKEAIRVYKDGYGMTDLMNSIKNAVKKETIKKLNLFGCCNKA